MKGSRCLLASVCCACLCVCGAAAATGGDVTDALGDNVDGDAFAEFERMNAMLRRGEFTLFPKCHIGPVQLSVSKFTFCVGATARHFVKNAISALNSVNCIPPSRSLLSLMDQSVERFAKKRQLAILLRRVTQCGSVCAREAACCPADKGAANFYAQGLASRPCANAGPCSVTAMSMREQLAVKARGPCDFAKLGFPDWELVRTGTTLVGGDMMHMGKRLLCNLFNTSRPRLNCVKSSEPDKCTCCCHDMRPVRGRCIKDKSNYFVRACD